MIELTAADIAAATGGHLAADPDIRVTGSVVIDSREVETGSLFVALAGEHVDGHNFADRAVSAGAALVLAARELAVPCVVVSDVERALGDLARVVLSRLRAAGPVRVAAVTGSVGKTTTKDLLGQILTPVGRTVVPQGSFNNEIGLPLTVLQADWDTAFVVAEMGASRVGNLEYLTSIAPPDVAVVLGVGAAHLGEFGGIDAVARAKAEIVTGLAPGGVAVLNCDDQRVAAMAAQAAGRVVTFGTGSGAQVRGCDVSVDAAGHPSLTVHDVRDGAIAVSAPVSLRLVGEHHVVNALAAAAVALELGVPLTDIAERLSAAEALSPHRMHVSQRPDGITVIDDSYNANPDSMRAALRALTLLAGHARRSVAVVGQMLELGTASREEHDQIGQLAVQLNVDLLVVVGEGAAAVLDGARRAGFQEQVRFATDVTEARQLLDAELTPGDIVLVKASNGSGLWRLGDDLAKGGRS